MYRFSLKQLRLLPLFLLLFGTFLNAQSHFNRPCEVFIGVETSPIAAGLKVDKTLENTPAQIAGIQAGDVILALDGVPVRSQNELLRERDKHQQGEAFTLRVLRDGVEKNIAARFKSCSESEALIAHKMIENAYADLARQETMKGFSMAERPILGIYENEEINVNGVAIASLVPGKGAEAAGLQSGDIVVKLDGKTITGSETLRQALASHKPGDRLALEYLRNGKTIQTQTVVSADRGYVTQRVERDPCKVFIGVYTSGNGSDQRGLRVSGIVDGTPAKESAVQPGDIILAFNGVEVNTYQQLTLERDKNKPGDKFRLSILRDGATMEIKARFKSCDTPGANTETETVQVLESEEPSEQRENPSGLDNTLKLEVFEAYPSPTLGPVNINFEAEAVPTTVRILDVSGKAVYTKQLPQFGGTFNEQVNLANNKSGNYILSIQQGGKVFSKQIVLMPRA